MDPFAFETAELSAFYSLLGEKGNVTAVDWGELSNLLSLIDNPSSALKTSLLPVVENTSTPEQQKAVLQALIARASSDPRPDGVTDVNLQGATTVLEQWLSYLDGAEEQEENQEQEQEQEQSNVGVEPPVVTPTPSQNSPWQLATSAQQAQIKTLYSEAGFNEEVEKWDKAAWAGRPEEGPNSKTEMVTRFLELQLAAAQQDVHPPVTEPVTEPDNAVEAESEDPVVAEEAAVVAIDNLTDSLTETLDSSQDPEEREKAIEDLQKLLADLRARAEEGDEAEVEQATT